MLFSQRENDFKICIHTSTQMYNKTMKSCDCLLDIMEYSNLNAWYSHQRRLYGDCVHITTSLPLLM